jgi:positive regulator of sigma E activity
MSDIFAETVGFVLVSIFTRKFTRKSEQADCILKYLIKYLFKVTEAYVSTITTADNPI